MNVLPALSAIATAAVRRQFAATPEPVRAPAATPSWRVGLAALLDRAAHAVAPIGPRPAH